MAELCVPPQRPLQDATYIISVPPSSTTPELYLGLNVNVLPPKEIPIVTLPCGKVSGVFKRVLRADAAQSQHWELSFVERDQAYRASVSNFFVFFSQDKKHLVAVKDFPTPRLPGNLCGFIKIQPSSNTGDGEDLFS